MISFILIGIALLAGIIGLLCGLSRRTPRELLHLATVVLAAVLAFVTAHPLASLLCRPLRSVAENRVPQLAQTLELLEQSAVFTELSGSLVVAVFSCFLFALLFLICLLLLKIPYAIAAGKLLGKERKNLFTGDRAVGAALGFLCGLVCFCLFLMPVAGLFGTGMEALRTLPEEQRSQVKLPQVVSDLEDDRILRFSASFCGVYDGLMTMRVCDVEVSFALQIPALAEIYAHAQPFWKEGTPSEMTDAGQRIAEDIRKNPLACLLLADTASGFARAWQSGQSYFGVQPPEIGTLYQPAYQGLLTMFSSATATVVPGDLETLDDVVELMKEYAAQSVFLPDDNDYSSRSVLEKLSEEGLVRRFLTLLSENSRTEPLVVSSIDSGMGSLFRYLEASVTKAEVRDELMRTTVGILNGQRKDLQESIRRTFWEAGVVTDAGLMQKVSKALDAAFTKREEVTVEELEGFFAEAFDLDREKQIREGTVNEDTASGAVSVHARKLRAELHDLRLGGQLNVDWSLVQGLRSVQTFETTRSVFEDLLVDPDRVASVTGDARAQDFLRMEDIIAQISRFVLSVQNAKRAAEELGEGSLRAEELDLRALGIAIDIAMESHMLEGKGEKMLDVVLHSSLIQGLLPLAVRESIDSEQVMQNPNANFENLFMVLQRSIEIKENLSEWKTSDGAERMEKLESSMDWLMENLNPETAKILAGMLSPEVVKQYGVPAKYAQGVSRLFGILFEKISKL